MHNFLLILFYFSSGCFSLLAQEGYPKPNVKDLLFYIQHNRGKNTYLYQTNIDKQGNIVANDPVKISRQMFDNNGEIKSITAIQRKFAYGIDSTPLSDRSYELSLVSYPQQRLYLRSTTENNYFVETTLNGIKMKINRLFIFQKEGTSGLNTKVDYILFFGTDQKGKHVHSKLVID
jgi:hypothetical protein